MKIPKWVLIIILLVMLGLFGYIIFLKKNAWNAIVTTTSAVEVVKWTLTDSIVVTGNAALANEQKLKFGQTGKISEIFVKVGDAVKAGDVLASLDKRNFFQEMAQAQNELEKINKNIAEEKAKINGPETRQLERQILSMERKLSEMKQDLSRTVQNSPGKSKEKVLDINAKKRELEAAKDKYALDMAAYEKEEKNQKELIAAKVLDGTKLVRNTIQNSAMELGEMRQVHRNLNKIFGFNTVDLTSEETHTASRVAQNDSNRKSSAERTWKEAWDLLENYYRLSVDIGRNSEKPDDATGLTNESLRFYKTMLEAIDIGRMAAESSEVNENSTFTRADLDKVIADINTMRSDVHAKMISLNEKRENILVADSPEKIKEKFLLDLKNKKVALEKAKDDIKRMEIQISYDEKNVTFIGEWRIENTELQKEIADKQFAILDQEDSILSKKDELEKIQSGKSSALENLISSRKNQLSEIEKMKTREESFEIRAPFSGSIRAIKMQVGDVLGGNSGSGEEKTILLENSEMINVKVALNQLDIVKVSLGQEANITFEAVPGAVLQGKITEISSTPSTQGGDMGGGGGLSSYEVIISAERWEHAIYSGMNAMVEIPLNEWEEALLVPITAINEDPNTFEKYVNLIDSHGNITKTIVETGKTNKSQIEILSGLSEWQKVQIIDFNANTFKSDDFSPQYVY